MEIIVQFEYVFHFTQNDNISLININMKKYLFFLIIAIAFCSSCQHKASNKETVDNDTIVEEPAFRVINFTENLTDCGKPLVLSDIVSNAEYIKLETTEKDLLRK